MKVTELENVNHILLELNSYIESPTNAKFTKSQQKLPKNSYTYEKAILTVHELSNLQLEFNFLVTQSEIFSEELSKTENSSYQNSSELKSTVQDVIDKLHKPMNKYYQLLQGDKSQTIRLKIDTDKETETEQLNLTIDFDKNRREVQPIGYLNIARMHSIALAFRLASVKILNPEVPILILDDIVNSYDPDIEIA